MEITLRVDRKGHLPGTLGWLLERAAGGSVRLYATKSGGRAAELLDASGARIEVLAGVLSPTEGTPGPWTVERHADQFYPCALHPWTDAAWRVIEKLASEALEILQTDDGNGTLTLRKVG